ncbi:unnamed protein product [Protopolystoma xenopodis]|uniref:Uncharacterized protein n=1 Tax=Protopolystoma xenopodis TaxID=117903 RepID=A0A448XB07_9PLAT|nr:unnamed protein product [Protopolystoma xenopodis]
MTTTSSNLDHACSLVSTGQTPVLACLRQMPGGPEPLYRKTMSPQEVTVAPASKVVPASAPSAFAASPGGLREAKPRGIRGFGAGNFLVKETHITLTWPPGNTPGTGTPVSWGSGSASRSVASSSAGVSGPASFRSSSSSSSASSVATTASFAEYRASLVKVRQYLLYQINRAVSDKVLSFLDVLQQSCIGTLERTVEALDRLQANESNFFTFHNSHSSLEQTFDDCEEQAGLELGQPASSQLVSRALTLHVCPTEFCGSPGSSVHPASTGGHLDSRLSECTNDGPLGAARGHQLVCHRSTSPSLKTHVNHSFLTLPPPVSLVDSSLPTRDPVNPATSTPFRRNQQPISSTLLSTLNAKQQALLLSPDPLPRVDCPMLPSPLPVQTSSPAQVPSPPVYDLAPRTTHPMVVHETSCSSNPAENQGSGTIRLEGLPASHPITTPLPLHTSSANVVSFVSPHFPEPLTLPTIVENQVPGSISPLVQVLDTPAAADIDSTNETTSGLVLQPPPTQTSASSGLTTSAERFHSLLQQTTQPMSSRVAIMTRDALANGQLEDQLEKTMKLQAPVEEKPVRQDQLAPPVQNGELTQFFNREGLPLIYKVYSPYFV